MGRSTKLLIVLAVIASLAIAAAPAIANTWSAYGDWTGTNPSGAWTYGYSTTLGGTLSTFPTYTDSVLGNYVQGWTSSTDPSNWYVAQGSNINWYAHPTGVLYLATGSAGQYAICRWTVPATDTYTISALMQGNTADPVYGHRCGVHMLKNGVSLKDAYSCTTSPIFNVRPVPFYGVLSLTAGDTIDFVDDIGFDAEAGAWFNEAQLSATIRTGSYAISGTVQDSYGHGLGGVKVTVVGTNDYAVTDATGAYSLSLFEGSYSLQASVAHYNTSAAQGVNITGPGTSTVNFTLTDNGYWNATNDWAVAYPTNGQWSYGYTHTSAYAFTPFSVVTAGTKRWTTPGVNAWMDAINQNGTAGPGTWAASPWQTVLRWTAPAAGNYSFKTIMKNTDWSQPYPFHWSYIKAVLNNTTQLFTSQCGTYQPLRWQYYVDCGGVLALNAGDTVDVVTNNTGNGDTSLDSQVKAGTYSVTGHVQGSNGQALGGVKIAVAGTNDYAVTDQMGRYDFTLYEGTYTLTASLSSFVDSSQPLTISGPGVNTVNFTLTNTGVWNAKNDFNVATPINGQWTYGWVNHTTEPMNTTGFAGFSKICWTGYDGMSDAYWAWNDTGVLDWNSFSANTPWVGIDYGTANTFLLRPRGSNLNDKAAITRWTAPAAGWYSYNGFFRNDTNNHTYGCDVVKNGNVNLFTQTTLVGYAPNNQANFAGAALLAAGDTIDFVGKTNDADDNRGFMKLSATVQTGAPGFQGHVQNSSLVSLAGATVKRVGGSETAVTDSAGNYILVLSSPGTYSVAASKPGYETVTYNDVTVGSNLVTKDFTLPTGRIISGNVTENFPPNYPIIAGANMATSDGVYSTTTDSAGNYSIQVTSGTYGLTVYKLGHLAKTVNVDATSGSVVQNIRLDIGYDFAYDFSGANNPTGAWNYGYATGTAYKQTGPDSFKVMDSNGHWSQNPVQEAMWYKGGADTYFPWGGDPGSERPVWDKNLTYEALEGGYGWYGGNAVREARKVVANPSSTGNVYAVARFVAPTSGYFHVTARFAGVTPGGTTSKVALMYGNSYIFGGPSDVKSVSGFAGRAANGFSDSTGTAAVYTYTFDKDIALGDKFDALILNDVTYPRYQTGGSTQVDVTIVKDATTLTGRITSSLPGNPPIIGATVTANGWVTGVTYQTVTDGNGYYVLSARPDTYDLEAKAPGYNTSPTNTVSVAQNGVTITNFTLNHSGTWSLANDFSPNANPCGQWSFGSVWTTTGAVLPGIFNFTPYTAFGNLISLPMQGWNGIVPNQGNAWACWIAKNTTGAPVTWNVGGPAIAYVEPNHISFAGGDTYGTGAPAIRWTAPDNRIVSINLTLAGQDPESPAGVTYLTVMHNLTKSNYVSFQGFVGRSAAGFTDSVGPQPIQTWTTTQPVVAGDTFEFAIGRADVDQYTHWSPNYGWPTRSMDIFLTISPGTGTAATTIAGIKALNQGDTVFVTAPLQLACPTVGAQGFDKAYGNSTAGSGSCFYVQNADRTQGIKCLHDGTVPTYDSSYKITFTGVVDVQQGQKVVRIQSINSAVAGTAPKPLGKIAKSQTNSNTLVKVWGKVTQLVANTGSDNDKYQYEYIVINDGSQDIKIPMHVQFNYMAGDAAIVNLAIGHMVAITGIAGTSTGTDVVVYPRNVYDIYDYTDSGRM